jgi:hypothetical protein
MPMHERGAAHPEEQELPEPQAAPPPGASSPDGQSSNTRPEKRAEWEGYNITVLNDFLDP